jgi:hypothetical protein
LLVNLAFQPKKLSISIWANFKIRISIKTSLSLHDKFSGLMYEKTYPSKRFQLTLDFLKKHIATTNIIFDLGVPNPFSKIMQENEYQVINTNGEDLDTNQTALLTNSYTVFTAFEIFEHLLNPFTVLQNVKCDKVLISVPMRLWFSSAYRSKTDKWDRHYHEFEDWQLDWLLEKTGFKIVDRIQFTHPVKKFGFRPILRYFTNRYYLVYAVRE